MKNHFKRFQKNKNETKLDFYDCITSYIKHKKVDISERYYLNVKTKYKYFS